MSQVKTTNKTNAKNESKAASSLLHIQLVSDIHVEFWPHKDKFNFIKPSAPVLALLGDICCCGSDSDFEMYKRFINELVPYYEHIIIISGNHEYYFNLNANQLTAKGTFAAIDKKIRDFTKTNSKLHYLNNSSIKLTIGKNNYLIAGSTLWSWIPEDQRARLTNEMNDYRYIYASTSRNLTANDVAALHVAAVKYIKSQIIRAKKMGYKLIVLTHHKPYISPEYRPTNLYCAYESDLKYLIQSPIVLWAYGHTHVADKSKVNGVNMYSNPKGYPKQKTLFDRAASIKL